MGFIIIILPLKSGFELSDKSCEMKRIGLLTKKRKDI